jgi:hypothetical protein
MQVKRHTGRFAVTTREVTRRCLRDPMFLCVKTSSLRCSLECYYLRTATDASDIVVVYSVVFTLYSISDHFNSTA